MKKKTFNKTQHLCFFPLSLSLLKKTSSNGQKDKCFVLNHSKFELFGKGKKNILSSVIFSLKKSNSFHSKKKKDKLFFSNLTSELLVSLLESSFDKTIMFFQRRQTLLIWKFVKKKVVFRKHRAAVVCHWCVCLTFVVLKSLKHSLHWNFKWTL